MKFLIPILINSIPILFFIGYCVIVGVSRLEKNLDFLPSTEEFFMWASPAFLILVTADSIRRATKKGDTERMLITFVLTIIVAWICTLFPTGEHVFFNKLFTKYHANYWWSSHLVLYIFIYISYLIADLFIIAIVNDNNYVNEIKNASKTINVPSFVALVCVLCFLLYITSNEVNVINMVGGLKNINNLLADFHIDSPDKLTSPIKSGILYAFVHGLIAFHMITSSLAYLLVTR